jgi:Rhodopirellula transposase DDE domain
MIDWQAIRQRWEADGSKRDERGRRLFAASEARAAGWGGLVAVSSVTGLARSTIGRGLKDLDAPPLAPGQVRREGGGPRSLTETDATLLDDLQRLVEPATLGDPVRPLLWVSKSLAKLASALVAMGHSISPNSVRKLLIEIGFSRQVNRKADEGSSHPDRNGQFEYINAEVLAAQAAGQPVISVDTKVHDFEDNKLGKVAPYGVYDIAADAGWISLGVTCDTAEFAVASIRTWLERIGRARYPKAGELTITADCGGSNGARVRLWKVELQKLADETGLTIKVRHYPPGTSKWNKIERRLFCRITQNWRGRPLTDHATIIELIAATSTKTGLKVESALDTRVYEKGIKVTKSEIKRLDIRGDAFHPEWNYSVVPRKPKS